MNEGAVTFGVIIGKPDGVEEMGRVEIVKVVDEETLIDIDGNPDDTDREDVILALADTPGDELLLADIVGNPDEAEVVGKPLEGGTVGKELFAEIVGILDEAEKVLLGLWLAQRLKLE